MSRFFRNTCCFLTLFSFFLLHFSAQNLRENSELKDFIILNEKTSPKTPETRKFSDEELKDLLVIPELSTEIIRNQAKFFQNADRKKKLAQSVMIATLCVATGALIYACTTAPNKKKQEPQEQSSFSLLPSFLRDRPVLETMQDELLYAIKVGMLTGVYTGFASIIVMAIKKSSSFLGTYSIDLLTSSKKEIVGHFYQETHGHLQLLTQELQAVSVENPELVIFEKFYEALSHYNQAIGALSVLVGYGHAQKILQEKWGLCDGKIFSEKIRSLTQNIGQIFKMKICQLIDQDKKKATSLKELLIYVKSLESEILRSLVFYA